MRAGDMARLARAAAAAGALGRGRSALLRRLVQAADGHQAPTVRAHAVRALGGACRADPRLLGLAEVQAGIGRARKARPPPHRCRRPARQEFAAALLRCSAQECSGSVPDTVTVLPWRPVPPAPRLAPDLAAAQDEAASVRQAAVDLLGAHLAAEPGLAAAYFDTLVAASRDASTSVRKAALRTLWEACIRPPGFPRAAQACCAVLHRGADAEESIQELVGQVFQGLWFASGARGARPRLARAAPPGRGYAVPHRPWRGRLMRDFIA